ncbi:MAG: recombinase family protein [Clostridia bacterium]|nr:recombinase family protein [Clostridia bacterium]
MNKRIQRKTIRKGFSHPQHKRLLRKRKAGDTLVMKSIEWLGRNYDEIIEQWRIITKEMQAAIVVLDMPPPDAQQGHDLTGTLIADIVLQLLSYAAQAEREFIKRRQAEGTAAAKARGVRFATDPRSDTMNMNNTWQNGMIIAKETARQLQLSHNTFLHWVGADESIER